MPKLPLGNGSSLVVSDAQAAMLRRIALHGEDRCPVGGNNRWYRPAEILRSLGLVEISPAEYGTKKATLTALGRIAAAGLRQEGGR